MKHFILLIVLLEIAVIYTDNLSKNQGPRPISKFMKKLKHKIGKISTSNKAAIRVLQNDNTTQTSDLYDVTETDDSGKAPDIPTVPTTTPNSYNYTNDPSERDESTVYIPLEPIEPEPNPTTTKPVVTNDNKPLKLTGFGNFKPKVTKDNSPILTWFTYFRYYSGIKPKIVTYTINIAFRIRRRLEERTLEKDALCSLVGDKNDFLQYDCNTELKEEDQVDANKIETVSLDPVKSEFTFDGKKTQMNELDVNEEAIEEMKNLKEQEEDPYIALVTKQFIRFNYGDIDTSKAPNFTIHNMNLVPDNYTFKQETGNYIFRFFDNNLNETKDYPCSISKNSDSTYDLQCKAEVPFNTNVNERIGTGVDALNKENQVLVQLKNGNVVLNPTTRPYYKENSSGLSGAAIAGIVIVCIVALVAISVVIIMLRNRSMKAVPQEPSSVVNMNI